MERIETTRYPLILFFRKRLFVGDVEAEVRLKGRVLAEHEADGWWFYGVNPGAIAAGDKSIILTHERFANSLLEVLFDFANETKSLVAFRAVVRKFFKQSDEKTVKEWEEAVAQVRAGTIALADLNKVDAQTPLRVLVRQVRRNKSAYGTWKDNANDRKRNLIKRRLGRGEAP